MPGDSDELLVALALRRRAELYAVAVDRRDGALFAAQFTEGGVLEAPRGRFVGRAALCTVPAMTAERYRATFHAVLQQVPDIDGDAARAETYGIARHFYRNDAGQNLCYEMTIRYQDEFERSHQGWLFSRRELVVEASHRFAVDEPAHVPAARVGGAGGRDGH